MEVPFTYLQERHVNRFDNQRLGLTLNPCYCDGQGDMIRKTASLIKEQNKILEVTTTK